MYLYFGTIDGFGYRGIERRCGKIPHMAYLSHDKVGIWIDFHHIKSDGGYILVWYHFYMHSNICIQSVCIVKNLFTTSQYKICIKISCLNNFEWIYFKINYWILLNTTEYYWILLNITGYYWILNITEFFKSLNIQMRGLLNIQLLQVSLTVLTASEFIFPGNIHWQWIYLPRFWTVICSKHHGIWVFRPQNCDKIVISDFVLIKKIIFSHLHSLAVVEAWKYGVCCFFIFFIMTIWFITILKGFTNESHR